MNGTGKMQKKISYLPAKIQAECKMRLINRKSNVGHTDWYISTSTAPSICQHDSKLQ